MRPLPSAWFSLARTWVNHALTLSGGLCCWRQPSWRWRWCWCWCWAPPLSRLHPGTWSLPSRGCCCTPPTCASPRFLSPLEAEDKDTKPVTRPSSHIWRCPLTLLSSPNPQPRRFHDAAPVNRNSCTSVRARDLQRVEEHLQLLCWELPQSLFLRALFKPGHLQLFGEGSGSAERPERKPNMWPCCKRLTLFCALATS